MRAAVITQFGEIEDVTVRETADPVPAAGQLLIDIHAAPVNYVDLLVVGGKYQFLPKLPFIPGKGPAGAVSAIGADVAGWKIGDRVLAMAEQGGYAEKVAVAADQCYRLPDSMSFAEAASISLAYDTSWFALRERARIQPGERVLVLGASGAVGLASVQLAKAMGALVLGGISRPEKAESVLKAGADAVVDLSGPDIRTTLRDRVLTANDGKLVDIVIDPLGGDIFGAAIRTLAWRGRLVVVGFAAGYIPTIKVNYLMLKNIEVSGLQVSDYRKRRPERVAECYAEIFAYYAAGKIGGTQIVPYRLDDVAQALAAVRDRTATGRTVLQIRPG
jgi:NADPH:quinone reductase